MSITNSFCIVKRKIQFLLVRPVFTLKYDTTTYLPLKCIKFYEARPTPASSALQGRKTYRVGIMTVLDNGRMNKEPTHGRSKRTRHNLILIKSFGLTPFFSNELITFSYNMSPQALRPSRCTQVL